jgi:hypothetical protein
VVCTHLHDFLFILGPRLHHCVISQHYGSTFIYVVHYMPYVLRLPSRSHLFLIQQSSIQSQKVHTHKYHSNFLHKALISLLCSVASTIPLFCRTVLTLLVLFQVSMIPRKDSLYHSPVSPIPHSISVYFLFHNNNAASFSAHMVSSAGPVFDETMYIHLLAYSITKFFSSPNCTFR